MGQGPKSSKNGLEYYPMFFLDCLLISALLNKMKLSVTSRDFFFLIVFFAVFSTKKTINALLKSISCWIYDQFS